MTNNRFLKSIAIMNWSSSAVVVLKPLSRTSAVERPQANEVSTESLQIKSAGISNFSKRNSVNLIQLSLLWIEFSVIIRGVSFD